jgi:hypothetical protein
MYQFYKLGKVIKLYKEKSCMELRDLALYYNTFMNEGFPRTVLSMLEAQRLASNRLYISLTN